MKVDSGLFFSSGSHDIAKQARALEDAGYDGAWTSETGHDPFIPLAIAAGASSSIQLGTAIAVAFARNPMNLASLGNDLQMISEGRFILGLGSQVRAHIEKRFSMPWSHPAARMHELIVAIRTIWSSWQDGSKLDFRGQFYTHTLMTPFFNPGPNPFGSPKIFLAAVGEQMTEVAGEVADGLLVHGFTTERYLREVTLPALERGLAQSGRSRDQFEISYPGFVVTGANEDEIAAASHGVKSQIAFYASTPAYAGVLDLHGWGDLQPALNALSKAGKWEEMASQIDDEMLETFAVICEPENIPARVTARFGDLVDRFSVYAPYSIDNDRWKAALAGFKSHDT
jgi:probable F420-dependent oxidoreductase